MSNRSCYLSGILDRLDYWVLKEICRGLRKGKKNVVVSAFVVVVGRSSSHPLSRTACPIDKNKVRCERYYFDKDTRLMSSRVLERN